MAASEIRRQVFEGFKSNSFFLDKEALGILTDFVLSMQDFDAVISQLVNAHLSGTTLLLAVFQLELTVRVTQPDFDLFAVNQMHATNLTLRSCMPRTDLL